VPVIGLRIGGSRRVVGRSRLRLVFEPGDAKSLQVAARRVRDEVALREARRGARPRSKNGRRISAARSLQILENTHRGVDLERRAA
jgi:hypothetical protein